MVETKLPVIVSDWLPSIVSDVVMALLVLSIKVLSVVSVVLEVNLIPPDPPVKVTLALVPRALLLPALPNDGMYTFVAPF